MDGKTSVEVIGINLNLTGNMCMEMIEQSFMRVDSELKTRVKTMKQKIQIPLILF